MVISLAVVGVTLEQRPPLLVDSPVGLAREPSSGSLGGFAFCGVSGLSAAANCRPIYFALCCFKPVLSFSLLYAALLKISALVLAVDTAGGVRGAGNVFH